MRKRGGRRLELLVDAGLSPLDALRTATLSPGRFVAQRVDAEARFGRIELGYRADVVVVDADPLEEVSRLWAATAVVARGRWLDRPALDVRLEALTEKGRALTP